MCGGRKPGFGKNLGQIVDKVRAPGGFYPFDLGLPGEFEINIFPGDKLKDAVFLKPATGGGMEIKFFAHDGVLGAVAGSPFAAGTGTFDIQLDSTGTYVYAANRGDGTISGFTIVPGTTAGALKLTPLSGSPYVSGIGVQSLGFDSTGKYLLAAAVGGSTSAPRLLARSASASRAP